jgi:hypothetical protein
MKKQQQSRGSFPRCVGFLISWLCVPVVDMVEYGVVLVLVSLSRRYLRCPNISVFPSFLEESKYLWTIDLRFKTILYSWQLSKDKINVVHKGLEI